MNKNHYIIVSHTILSEIFLQKAYTGIALNRNLSEDTENKELIVRIVYGVVERSAELEDVVTRFTHSIKPSIMIILKIVAYCHLYLDSLPPYAIVSNATEYAKSLFLGNYAPLVNACSRKITSLEKAETREIVVTLPEKLKEKLTEQYGAEKVESMEDTAASEFGHIRPNTNRLTLSELKKKLDDDGVEYSQSKALGLFVKANAYVKSLFSKGMITYQSPSSMLAVQCLGARRKQSVLDLCSAPGGKAIYISELTGGCEVTACDIHPHRLELVKIYVERMNARNIKMQLSDAKVKCDDFVGKFDCVLCDMPCTGTGMVFNKPDMLLSSSKLDGLSQLVELQKAILSNAKDYVKDGGTILYCTCSVLDEENGGVIKDFLSQNPDFSLTKLPISGEDFETAPLGYLQLLPSKMWDGFYIAKMIKKSKTDN